MNAMPAQEEPLAAVEAGPGRIRVLLVDDQSLWRDALRADLTQDAAVEIVGEAGDGSEAVERAAACRPDVVLMDVAMPTMNGIEATRRIHKAAPGIRILMVSAVDEEGDVLDAVKAGAVGYVLKTASTDFIDSVRRVARGEVIFTPSLAGAVLSAVGGTSAMPRTETPFSEEEKTVLALFSEGRAVEEIAASVGKPTGEIRNEVPGILARLHKRYQAVVLPTAPHKEQQVRVVHTPPEIRRRPVGERPPLPRELGGAGRFWLTMVLAVLFVAVLLIVAGPASHALQRWDVRSAAWFDQHRGGRGVSRAFDALASPWWGRAIRWGTILLLVAFRRWRHLLILLASALLVGVLTSGVLFGSGSGTSTGLGGFAHPFRPIAMLAVSLLGVAYAAVPEGRWRRWALLASGIVLVAVASSVVVLGIAFPTQVLVALTIGVAVPVLGFRIFAPSATYPVGYKHGRAAHLDIHGQRGRAITGALEDQLGIEAIRLQPFGLAGSGGSTPMRILVSEEPDAWVFGKLYAVNHLRADRWYKLGRMIFYGSLEDEKPFNSVRRLVEYEDYLLRYMRDHGVPTAAPIGFVELTPEREYVIVTEFLDGAREITDATVDEHVVLEALEIVRGLWDAGLAHRDIKPSNILVRDGKVYLIDVAFAQARPSPWRQAVDLSNMMLVLGLVSEPEDVYAAAQKFFTPDDIAEAFAATRGVTMPTQLRAMIKKSGRDLVEEFRAMAPERRPIPIQRWSFKRLAVTVGFVAVAVALVTLAALNIGQTGLW